jgi:N-acetylglucosamine-6-phosphate deacetylase
VSETFTLIGGSVVRADATLAFLDVDVVDGRIAGVRPPGDPPSSARVVDVTGMIVSPGFIDVQINGGWGHDFTSDPDSIATVAARLPETGVTTFLPTVITSTPDRRAAARRALRNADVPTTSAMPLGLHYEGPAISPDRVGAHPPSLVTMPADDELAEWTADAGVRLVTLAPELPDATSMIERLTRQGVVVSAGHTAATTAEFEHGIDAGITMVTHLFNAMVPFSHREPGPIGATLAHPALYAGLICDGIHIDPVAVRMAWRALGAGRTVLVTDAVAALGAEGPTATLGTMSVTVDERGVRTVDGVLAGSNLRLDVAVRNLVSFTGCTPAEGLTTVTSTPARALGIDDRGTIEVGARADLTVLDADLVVTATYIGGTLAWKS